jgi:fatty-acid desaturase
VRMLGITVGYHRYFSHRSFKTSRPFQFVLAWLGASFQREHEQVGRLVEDAGDD